MISKDSLLSWLRKADSRLTRKMTVIAVGGTAMTLLGLKPSTRDIDLCIRSEDREELSKALGKEHAVDFFIDGYIFSEQLPDDYIGKSKKLVEMKNIELRVLGISDIIITKAARLNARDEEDIEAAAKHANKEELIERFKQVAETYAGREEDFRHNFSIILKRFFK